LEAIHELAGKKRLAIDFANPSERLCVKADPDRLQQILRNVLTNAVKFTPAGGAITVTLSRDGDWCQVEVRDTGEGIAPHFLPYLFEIFRQQEDGTRRKHAGLGIGLALVKRLTEAHGGTVRVSSEGIGRGTTVTLRLPLVPEVHEETEPMLPDVASTFAGLHVLVVEDMEDSREATRVMLEGLGANVEVAGGGAEALGVMSQEPFDVVLCDLRMPLMDGYEFINELHLDADHPHPPVVAISGLASGADHQRTAAAGFEGHIDKPFDEAALLRAVGAVMSRRRA
jgi:two-component system CheB/CheR fusion protein